MDLRPCTSKWQGDYSSKNGFSNFLRCFKDQVGSSSSRNQHRSSLERARSPKPCKLLWSWNMESHSRWKVKNLSRFNREWMLDHYLGLPVVDLFASRVNHQIPEFVSWRPEPGAIATDAFNIPWDFPLSYLLPPFCLIPMCLRKVMQEQVDCILIAPVWRSPAMVSSTPIHAYRVSSAIASGSENPKASRDRQDSSPLLPEEIPVSCTENFRKSLQNKSLSGKSVKNSFILLEKQHSQAI